MDNSHLSSRTVSRTPSLHSAAGESSLERVPGPQPSEQPLPVPRTRTRKETHVALVVDAQTPMRRDGSLKIPPRQIISDTEVSDHSSCQAKIVEITSQYNENEERLRREIAALQADRDTLKRQLKRNSMEQVQIRSLTASDGTPMDQSDLEAFQAKSEGLLAQIRHLSEENKKLAGLLQEMTEARDNIMDEKMQLSASVQESQERLVRQAETDQISLRNQFHKEYKTVIDTLEDQVKDISAERDQIRRELQDVQSQSNQVAREHQQQMNGLESKFNEILGQKKQLENENLTMKEEFENQLSHVKSQLSDTERENERLVTDLQKVQSEQQQLSKTRQSENDKLFELESRCESLLREKERLEKSFGDEVSHRHSLIRRLEEVERDRDALSQQCKEFLGEINNMESQLKHGTRSLNEVDRLEEKVQELMVERDMLKSSLLDTKSQYEATHQQLQHAKDECARLHVESTNQEPQTDGCESDSPDKSVEDSLRLISLEQQLNDARLKIAELSAVRDVDRGPSRKTSDTCEQTENLTMVDSAIGSDVPEVDFSQQLAELNALRSQHEESQQKVIELENALRVLQEQLAEKERVLYQAKSQYMRRLNSTESSLQDKCMAVEQLTQENDELMNQLRHLQSQIAQEPGLALIPRQSESTVDATSLHLELEQLKEQLKVVQEERDSLLSSQKSLLQRQLEQVNDRDRLESEIDKLRKQIESLNSTMTRDDAQRRPSGSGLIGGWLRNRDASGSSTENTSANQNESEQTILEDKHKSQIQKLMAEHEAAESELKHKLQELQQNLNELLVSHDAEKTDHEQLIRDKDEQIAKVELEIKKLTEDYERQLTEKEQEMGHLKRLHFYYGKIRRQYRNNEYATVFEEPEEDGEDAESRELIGGTRQTHRTTLSAASQTPVEMLEDARHQLSASQNEIALSGDPFDMDVDPESARRLQHVRLPFDVPTLHQHIHKLLVTISHLRETLQDAQGELKRLQFENDNLKDDLVHVNTVLEQDRQSAHQSISDWENWANEVQASYSTGLKTRDDQIEMLKAELELAKEEWGQIVWDKENTILHLTESRRNLVQQLFEECSLRLNSMQKVMEDILQEDDLIHQELTVVNLEKRKRESIVNQVFGDLNQDAVLKRRSANLDVNSLLNEYMDDKERQRQRRNSTGSSVQRNGSEPDSPRRKRWSFWN